MVIHSCSVEGRISIFSLIVKQRADLALCYYPEKFCHCVRTLFSALLVIVCAGVGLLRIHTILKLCRAEYTDLTHPRQNIPCQVGDCGQLLYDLSANYSLGSSNLGDRLIQNTSSMESTTFTAAVD